MNGRGGRFAYRAVRTDGETLSSTINAPDRATALRKLAQTNLTVISLERTGRAGAERRGWRRNRAGETERRLVLKQLAIMVRAGVDLLEALETARSGLPEGLTRDGLGDVAARLRRGEKIAPAMAAAMPEYPRYVTALIAAGEASGELDRVMDEAGAQMTAEARIRRDVKAALVYPTFLVCAGLLVMGFLFYVVVPRFSAMLGPQRETLTGLPNLVITIGETFSAMGPFALLVVALPVVAVQAAFSSTEGRQRIVSALSRVPGVRRLVAARQRIGWTRIMSFGISAGVGVLESARLAMESATDERVRGALGRAIREIRAGRPVSEAMGGAQLLTPLDLSLVRVGQRTGTLGQMFATIADVHEEQLLDMLKRATVIIEQLAIAFVASAIGVIVISLVSAMTSIYESIG